MFFWILIGVFFIFLGPFLFLVFIFSNFLLPFSAFSKDCDLEYTEDLLLKKKCDARVRHGWKEINFYCGGGEFSCRAHFLRIPHPDAPTILLLHGNGSSSICFREIFDALSRDFDVVALDLPGFGRSTSMRPSRELSTEFYAQFIYFFLCELSLTRVFVAGHSFGGFVGSVFACRYPHRVSHLLLIDSAGIFPTLGWSGAYWGVFFKFSVLQSARNFGIFGGGVFSTLCRLFGFDALEAVYWHAIFRASWGDKVVGEHISVSWTRSQWTEPILPLVCKLRIPIATVYGRHDCIMPLHQGEILRDIWGWGIFILEQSGHSPFHGVDAGVLAGHILEFFGNCKASSAAKRVDTGELLQFESSFSPGDTLACIERMYEYLHIL